MKLNKETVTNLIKVAKSVSENAFNPLSKFSVGAAIIDKSGMIFSGCNIEFDNYSNTIHAEEAAIASMISSGHREPRAIAIFTLTEKVYFPCGMCRQSLFEIGGEKLYVISASNGDQDGHVQQMSDLLPYAFRLSP